MRLMTVVFLLHVMIEDVLLEQLILLSSSLDLRNQ